MSSLDFLVNIFLRRNLDLVWGFAISMTMQTLSVKLLSFKILKTKNCVTFEVQYYSIT